MVTAVVNTSGTAIIKDATNYNTGATTDVKASVLYRDSVGTGTSSVFNHNSNTLIQDQTILSVPLLSFDMLFTSGYALGSSDGNLNAQISSTATDEGGLIASISGMKQTGTVIPSHQMNTFATTSLTQPTYTITTGQTITCGYESNGGTLTPPPAASNGDTYDEEATGAHTGSPLTQGKIYTLTATSDMSTESIGWSLTGSNSGSWWLDITDAEPSGGETITIDSGSYSISGTDILLKADFNTVLDSGSYVISGTETPIFANFNTQAESGSYILTGTDVDLLFVGNMTIEAGSYIITGTEVILRDSGDIWTDTTPVTTTWNDQSGISTTWTDTPNTSTIWTDL